MKLDNKGLSIMEVVVALGVIIVGMLGIISLLAQNIKISTINKNKLLASMLAQEGLELVRNKRDANWVNGNLWNDGLVDADETFTIDYKMNIDRTANSINDSGAILKNNAGFYEHTAGSNTVFRRLITFTPDPGGAFAEVKCEIKWTFGSNTNTYEASTLLYDWK